MKFTVIKTKNNIEIDTNLVMEAMQEISRLAAPCKDDVMLSFEAVRE